MRESSGFCSELNICSVSDPCFEFGLSAVLGIAFGGFLIGVLLTGALWFIKIRTGKLQAFGMSYV